MFDPSVTRLQGIDGISRMKRKMMSPFRLSGWRSVISSDSTVWKSDGWELGATVSKLLGRDYDEVMIP